MKILAVCTSTNVYGAETVLLSLLEGLQQAGHEVLAVTSRWTDGQFPEQLTVKQIPFHPLPLGMVTKNLKWPYPWWSLQTILSLPILWWRFRGLCKNMNPDVILVSSVHQVPALWFVLGKSPVLMVTQFCPAAGDTRAEKLWKLVNRKITHWLACSGYIKRRLEQLGVPSSHVSIVHSATLDESSQTQADCSQNARLVPVLGIIGQIGAWKGHEDFIRAAGILRSRGHDFSIQIFGEGEPAYKEMLAAIVFQLGLREQIEWKGYVSSKVEIFQAIDICVVPSRFDDPYPTVVMEAASFGIPVVGTTRGGLPELVSDGKTGFLVPAEDPASLAERLAQLIQSPELRHQQGLAALERAGTIFQRSRMIADFTRVVSTLSR